MKKVFILTLLGLAGLTLQAQNKKTVLRFPEVNGYQVLKGDFHQHTVFSDGSVWPTYRVEEAYVEDLDIIAISDHIEYIPKKADIPNTDFNRSYEIAKPIADRYGIILIPAVEITRRMPPGHFNAIGIKDANAFEQFVNKEDRSDTTGLTAALEEAHRQGAFVFWNHPPFQTPENKPTWFPIHEELKNKKLIQGVEVANGRYDKEVFQWALDYDWTIFSNTDVHTTITPRKAVDKGKTSLTLVLAKDRTEESVMEALRDRRTVALFQNVLYGRKEHVEPIVANSINAKMITLNGNYFLEVENLYHFPYEIEILGISEGYKIRNRTFTLNGGEAIGTTVTREKPKSEPVIALRLKLKNVYITPEQNLEIEVPVR
ncbi:MAG: CehA/McbA family metallohydrolase [Bacteroidales bacterium]|nr:CehA/McbA family metallohydrolase [Bacteroidales bacterium]